MAIKISGTTVIDDNRQFTNLNEGIVTGNSYVKLPVGTTADRPVSVANGSIRYNIDEVTFEGYAAGEWGALGGATQAIDTPVNTSPANGEINVVATSTVFAATTIRHIYDLNPTYAVWQVSNTINFTSTVLNANVVSTSNTYTSNIDLGGQNTYYWRVKYGDRLGNESEFSTPTVFTTEEDPPTVLGQASYGGYYTGTIDIGGGVCYYLIVAPNATGCACCVPIDPALATGPTNSTSRVDGYAGTYPGMACPKYPAANFTATRVINGYSDWYIPGRDELGVMFNARNCMPAGEGYQGGCYTSGTIYNNSYYCGQRFFNGYNTINNVFTLNPVRALRRVPI